MERRTLFVDVLLPLHLPDTYTYRVPFEYNDNICVGQRVVVQFGAKRLYSALVRRVHEEVPVHPTKYIQGILDTDSAGNPLPIVTETQFRFWEWMAQYYMCYPGDVMAVAIPSSLRLTSESFIAIHPDFDGTYDELTKAEAKIVDALLQRQQTAAPVLSIDEVANITGYQKIMPLIKTMIGRHIIVMEEELKQRFAPKSTPHLTLHPQYLAQDQMRALFDRLESKQSTHKQLSVLMKFMQLSQFGKETIKKRDLTACKELSASAITTLIKNNVLLQEDQVENRLQDFEQQTDVATIQLSEQQQNAFQYLLQAINPQADEAPQPHPRVNLLHGVTSSGKTEVYIKLIDHVVRQGKQVLFLLPEIALTAQIINRLRKYFGTKVGVYHSKFNANERAELWSRTLRQGPDSYNIILGARSAIFLPFHNLGLVIVDEEHDSSYKQSEPAPRYSGRDSAIILAQLFNAPVVLGSATPSIETYFNAQSGKYGLTVMDRRFGGLQMPEVLCVDMKDATRKKEVAAQHFSHFLIHHMKEALAQGEQVILFQNRRGFSLHVECQDCGWIPQCKNCDVSLVYHKSTNSLRCHYCGYSIPVPSECPACHSTFIKMKGFGTERVEDDLSVLFPDATIARMDLDTTTQKSRYLEIINDFEDHKIDILIGTQMVTKGLDFNNVSVVGILSADNLISYPDFRAYERAFQLMTQVSGRAGRHGHQGKVIIQTFNPWHQAIRDAMDHNYASMYGSQIQERRVFRYPPYFRLIDITIRHKDNDILNQAAYEFARLLRTDFEGKVMGPEYPSVSRVRGYYIKKILIRFQRNENLKQSKQRILAHADTITHDKAYGRLLISFDVDPQ